MSWFQTEPIASLELIERLGVSTDTSVIDVGGGASRLPDRLVERRFADITVLDVSEEALAAGRRRLPSASVSWVRADLLSWRWTRRYGVWHDRAVFHFLTDERDQKRYLETLGEALEPRGCLIMATFAEDGPEFCSGLAVCRYSARDLVQLLGEGFEVTDVLREDHTTPAGVVQPFTWVAARRHGD
ncbi:MAG: class I SAM-dependent methyltransferase [Acidimicrobiales bacterium]